MRLFIDECLSPALARRLNASGLHEAVHPLDIGRPGESDHTVLERALAEDRIIVTGNARDFRRLVGNVDLHPGLIILPALDRETTWHLLSRVIAFLSEYGDPMRALVNHVAEIDASGTVTLSPLTSGDG